MKQKKLITLLIALIALLLLASVGTYVASAEGSGPSRGGAAISPNDLTGDCLTPGWTCTTTFSGNKCTGTVKSPEKHTFTMYPGGKVCSNTKKCSVTIKFSSPPTHCPWSFTRYP
ncbi:MAG TPA: hypothetical protein VLG46_13135 [Anaerolineae bacterium]|nr:hypothetical protein [Anaerolineae bacterium]